MEDKIRLNFLSQINQMGEEMVREHFQMIEMDFEKNLPMIVKEMAARIAPAVEQYRSLQETGDNGPLNWVYLSFLRSSVLDGAPCYRIDLYDERDRISEIECAGEWEFEYVFRHLREIHFHLQTEFNQQTRVKEWELDVVIYYLAEKFKNLAEKLIPDILAKLLDEYGADLFAGEALTFMLGELFDKSVEVCRWEEDEYLAVNGQSENAENGRPVEARS